MGSVGRRLLFSLRNALFNKLQSLPLAFFHQNKVGDLISRINNDTDKLNQFFAQALMQFIGSFFLMLGAGIFLLSLQARLGLLALAPVCAVIAFTRLVSPWVKARNAKSLHSVGNMSGEIQESLDHFKVILAFHRLDYFRDRFQQVNAENYVASIGAGIANNVFTPTYGLAAHLAQILVLTYGLFLITQGQLSLGLLIAFLLYVNNVYLPLRQLASVWSSFELAHAALDRIANVLSLESNLSCVPDETQAMPTGALEFRRVSFGYAEPRLTLRDCSFILEQGKTYAFVGPTGGGKTTTASLMARLYDPTDGAVFLYGKNLRSYAPDERARRIGFILQEPFLFTGTVGENIVYGNSAYSQASSDELLKALRNAHLSDLLQRFERGLETPVSSSGESLSLGQKQLIAFMRATLRQPDVLILDEATANIDTLTEQLLETILAQLPATTTKIVIAHRLNTIAAADEIFFVNAGTITRAGSFKHALDMLLHDTRTS